MSRVDDDERQFEQRCRMRHNVAMTVRVMRAVAVAAVLAVAWPTSACTASSTGSPPTRTGTVAETQSPTAGSEPGCGPPALRVLSPRDGARVTAPFALTYEISCFSVGHDGTIYFTVDGIRLDLHPQNSSGTVTVPDHPMLSGRRTVTIQLADTKGRALGNPEASMVMTIVIEGSRG
jgi:hypothetical protein